jgi:O-antigen ligase
VRYKKQFVLGKAPQLTRPENFKLANISLALVGLMWVFPFLHYRHENPLTTFDQEWWCAVLGVLALAALLTEREFWLRFEIPRIAQLPVALIGIAFLQASLGKVAYFDQALLYMLYLLFAALLMLLGARLRACFGIEKLSIALAFSLLIGAELSAMIGAIQHYQWHTPFDSIVVMQISSGLYGNVAQPNHFADYIALGLISLGLLFQMRKLNLVYVFLLSVPLLYAMTLSGSRSTWLYLSLMFLLAWWMARREVSLRPLLRYSALLVAGFGLMHLIVQLSFMAGADSGTTTVQRLLAYNGGGDTGGSIRLYLWHEAWLIFTQFPMLGAGFGQFSWHHFELLPLLQASNIRGLYNNAHNLVFQLAAETGLAGLLALFVPFGIWFHGLRRVQPSAAHWWGYAALGVLAIHSLLEYPLWYAYFLAIAAVLLGALDETRYRLAHHNLWRISLAAILLLGLLSLIQMRSGYQNLKNVIAIPVSSDNAESHIREGLRETQHGGTLLSPYVDLYIFSKTEVNASHIKQKIALGSNVMHFLPIASVVYRQAYFLAQDGQLDQSKRLLEQAIWSYPENGDAHQLLQNLARKDPVHFSGLLEFYLQKEQERARAVRNQ